MNRHRIWSSRLGKLTIVVDEGNRLVGIYYPDHTPAPTVEHLGQRDDSVAEIVVSQLSEYLAGQRRDFQLDLAPQGTEFQQEVWEALAKLGYGETTSYGALARAIGRPDASRAVGSAVGKNPLSIVVPCHRVIGGKGQLTGYAGGLKAKQLLLQLEGAELVAGG